MSDLAQTLEETQEALRQARERIQTLEATIEQLSASEKLHRDIADTQPDYLCRYDTDLRLIYANQAYCVRLDKRPEELLGRKILEWIPASEHPYIYDHVRSLTPENPTARSIREIIRHDGSKVWIEWLDIAILNEAGEVVAYQAVGRDVTSQYWLQQQVMRQNEILQQAHNLIALSDLDGNITYMNPAGMALCGFSSYEEVMRQKVYDFYTPEGIERLEQEILPALEHDYWHGENQLQQQDGTVIDVWQTIFLIKDGDTPVNYATIMRDIRGEKRSREALQRSQERFSKIFALLPLATAIIGRDDLRYVEVNSSFERLSGYSREEVIGRTSVELNLLERPLPMQHLVESANRTDSRATHEIHFRNRAGETGVGLLSAIPLELDGRECMLIAIQDVTEKRRVEEREQQMSRYLRGVMRAADELIAIEDRDMFERQAVEVLREHLGVERAGLFLLDEHGAALHGTYGTSPSGQLTEEHAFTLPASLLLDVMKNDAPWTVLEDYPYWHRDGDIQRQFGRGWVATTTIRIGDEPIGVLSNDTAISGAPFDPVRQEAIALYASLLGNMIKRRRAEARLRESEERYRVLVEGSNAVIAVFSVDGQYLFINEKGAEYFGKPVDQITGKNIHELYTPEGAAEFHTILNRIVETGEPLLYEEPSTLYPDHIYNTAIYPIRGKDGAITALMGYSVDVTPMRQAESALRESEERYRVLVESSNAIVLLFDTNGKFLFVNEKGAEYYGKPADQIIGKTVYDFYTPQAGDNYLRLISSIIESEKPIAYEEPLRLDPTKIHHTSLYPLRDENGVITSVMSQSVDVTPMRQAEAALRESEERYRKIVETASEGIWLVDTDAHITYTNNRLAQMIGYSVEELLGASIYDFMDDSRKLEMEHRLERRRQGIDEQYDFEYRRKDGSSLWVSVSATPFTNSRGEVINFLAMMTDITPRKLQEMALQQSEARQRALIRSLPDLILRTDANAVFLEYHAPDPSMLFTSPEDFIGKRAQDVLPQNIGERQAAAIREALQSGQTIYFEYSLKIEGTLRHFEARIAPVSKDEALTIVREITERKRGEVALQTANTMLEDRVRERTVQLGAIIDNSGDGIALVDARYSVQRANYAFREMFGIPATQEAVELLQLTSDENEQMLTELLEQLTSDHSTRRIELTLQKLDSSKIDVEISISLVEQTATLDMGYVCIFRDISERKRVQNAIAEERNLLRTLIDSIPDLVYVKDLEYRFVLCNQAHAKALGCQHPDELLGKTSAEFFPAARSADFHATDREVYKTGKPLIDYEHEAASKAGGFEWALTNKVPLYSVQGELIGLVGITRDITRRKQTEAILEQKYTDERQFQYYLRVMHELMVELTAIDNLEIFYQRVVEMAVGDLNFERCGLFLYDEETGEVIGTYGTDPAGNLRDERHFRFSIPDKGVLLKALQNPAHFHVEENVPLLDWHKQIGVGWNAGVALWQGDRALGWLVIDNLRSGTPATSMQLEVLAQYGMLIASLLALKQAEEALRRNEELYRSVVTSMTEGIILRNHDGIVQAYNDAAEKILGIPVRQLENPEMIDPNWHTIYEDGSPFPFEAYPSAITRRTGQANSNTIIGIHKPDGSLTWISVNSQPLFREEDGANVSVVTTITDVTSHKLAQDALQESESKYRQLVETMGGGITISNLDGEITYANDRFCQLIGMSREEVYKQGVRHLIDPANETIITEQRERLQRGESATYELNFILKGGRRITNLVNSSPMYDLRGELSGSFSVSIDITARKEAEEALRRALEREKELGQLKTQFVSTTSHEFRTPLATILATTETLLYYRDRLDNEQVSARLEKIRKQVEHLRQIMDDVLQLARIQARRIEFRPTKGNLHSLCEELVEEFNSGTEHRDRIHYHAPDRSTEMYFDPRLMRQIISNLLSNALKYSPREKHVDLSLQADEQSVTIRIQDYGMGIPPESLPHMFEPFHRASNVSNIPGTGLGLPIVKESVEVHGGTINLESKLNHGSTFTVILPMRDTMPELPLLDTTEAGMIRD